MTLDLNEIDRLCRSHRDIDAMMRRVIYFAESACDSGALRVLRAHGVENADAVLARVIANL